MGRPSRQILVSSISIAALISACDDATGPRGPGIHVLHATLSDTISATHPLILGIRTTSGDPAASVAVLLQTPSVIDSNWPVSAQFRVFVAQPGTTMWRIAMTDTTDAGGRISVQTRLGPTAGPADLVVTVPELGFVDTLRFTVRPGAAVGVTAAPADTAIYATQGFTLRVQAIDRYQNPRPDVPVEVSVASGPVTVNATAAVVATAIGRAAIVAQAVGPPDTAYVSVVPQAWVAIQQFDPGNGGPLGLFLTGLDGSGRERLGPGLDNSFVPQGFEWSPDGQQLALVRDRRVNLLTPGDTERVLVEMPDGVVTATRFTRDGEWVYFAMGYSGYATPAEEGLYRIKVDGSGLEHIGQPGTDYFAAPSHDGLSVAYVSYRSPCGVQTCIRVLDLATNQDRTYGTQDFLAYGHHVAWSPTQDLIAYESGANLILVRSDGTGSRVLANTGLGVRWMDWSPDGRWLAVAHWNGVMLIDVQTGLQLPLGQFRSYSATAWRP